MKYKNRIKRKQFVSEASQKMRHYIKKSIKTLEDVVESTYTLDKVIYEQIKGALDYGFEPRYYIYSNSIYHPSIESEYKNYHNDSADDKTYEKIFDVLSNSLLPSRLSKYTDIDIIVEEDEAGKYFEVKLI